MVKNILLLFCFLFLCTSCESGDSSKLRIAAAANMQFVIKDLVKSFTNTTGIECEIIISSSGKLTSQIQEGAPYDVFVSANMKYPNELFEKGLTTGEPKIYAYGKLILWSMNDDVIYSISDLKHEKIKHIAIANPKTSPYGVASIEVLDRYGFHEILKEKLVFGESISQVNQFIHSRAADIGFTSKSVLLSPLMKGKGNWHALNEYTFPAIKQGVVCLKNDLKKEKLALEFSDFLFSKKGKKIIKSAGYSLEK